MNRMTYLSDSDIPSKRCPTCEGPEENKWHPATPEYFYKTNKNGLSSRCKECTRKKSREYQASHQEEKKERDRNYYQRHHEAKLVYSRSYHAMHREEANAKSRAYQQEHREEISAKHREWYSAHHEDAVVKRRIYASQHSAEAVARVRMWRHADIERTRANRRVEAHRRRALQYSIPGSHAPAQIAEQLKRQHYRCYYAACGFSKFPKVKGKYVYEVDHTFPVSRVAGTNIPANDMGYLVLACKRCNQSKSDKYPWEFFEGGRLL